MAAKKLQIFVSSTYRDLVAERQAIVEAILMMGHIPAGMELFAAGDKSQLETIRRWISQSDIFVLILGGRYGSIEPESDKSYIQLEYEYALAQDKPLFAAVMSENLLDQKVKSEGKVVLETEHSELYSSFRKTVLSRMCKFFDDQKDLKLIVHESIPEITRSRELIGWVRGDEVLDPKRTAEEMGQLQTENGRLTKRVAQLEKQLVTDEYNGLSFDELVKTLSDQQVNIKKAFPKHTEETVSLLNVFVAFADTLAVGVSNFVGMSARDQLLFFEVAPRLLIYGLTEKRNVNNKDVQRFQTSAAGNRFLAKVAPLYQKLQPKVIKKKTATKMRRKQK